MFKVAVTRIGDRLVHSKICTVTEKEYRVSIDYNKYELWRAGELIQNVFPDLDLDQREFLISGFTPAEWSELYAMED